MPLIVLRSGTLFAPEGRGATDIMLGVGEVIAVGDVPGVDGDVTIDRDYTGQVVIPGLVDGHLHILGGGGGAGYGSRIPEVAGDAILEAGVTTCVGMPGVDVLTKVPAAMLARAYALERSGPRTRVMAGGFRWPAPALTGSVVDDLYLLPHIVGVKIALFEHTAAGPSRAELVRLLRELQWAAGATGKACLLHIHLGRSPGDRGLIADVLAEADVAPERVQVTHANYSPANLECAVALGRLGCWVDVNPLINPNRIHGTIAVPEAVRALVDAGVAWERITMSSDGNASVPRPLSGGDERFSYHFELLEAVRAVVEAGVAPLGVALALVTRTPACALRLDGVGVIRPGAAADLVVLDSDLRVEDVYRAGRRVVHHGRAVDPEPFGDPRRPIDRTAVDRGQEDA